MAINHLLINRVRLGSGLVLLAYVFCHFINHGFGLHSIGAMNDMRQFLLDPWQSDLGLLLLYGALVAHFSINIGTIWARRVLRLKPWQIMQMATGLIIPVFLIDHFLLNRGIMLVANTNSDFFSIQALYWLVEPWRGLLQVSALLITWLHGMLGLYYWVRIKKWFPDWKNGFVAFSVAMPFLSLSGFIASGRDLVVEAEYYDDFAQTLLADSNWSPMIMEQISDLRLQIFIGALIAIGILFATRAWRNHIYHFHDRPEMALPDGARFAVPEGASILETMILYHQDISALCGGKGRCTTCRVRILAGLDDLPAPNQVEEGALRRVNAQGDVRLACQCHPTKDLILAPLLPGDASADDGRKTGQIFGEETFVTILFIDLRGSTQLAERHLPFDVLFLLNQFMREMSNALNESDGHYSQFTGDGLMAIYGLHKQAEEGAKGALKGAKAMLERLDLLNETLGSHMQEPLRVGIGIHCGTAIVGEMGPPSARTLSAIGDPVNTAARLESLCKDFQTNLVISEEVIHLAQASPSDFSKKETVPIRGKDRALGVYIG